MKVLIVDDEKALAQSLCEYFSLVKIDAKCVFSPSEALKTLEFEKFDALILDLKMPEMSGIELLRKIKENKMELPSVMISAHGEIPDAVEAMQLGAKNFLVKPFNPDDLIIAIKKIVRIKTKDLHENSETVEWIGKSEALVQVKKIADKAARTVSTVLITGESGTGKEVAAKYIYKNSLRKDKPFIAVNISAFPEQLLESELFGYEKGAFTGAYEKKIGIFEASHGGTLFLDEIGDMPLHLQVKILRVLQEKQISRIGSRTVIPVDVRIIAATHQNLEKKVKEGTFREDLFYRINVVRIELPALRERKEDILDLISYFMPNFNTELCTDVLTIAPKAMQKLLAYEFPGNIRELENILERAMILSEGTEISDFDLNVKSNSIEPVSIQAAQKEAIVAALMRNNYHREKTSQELGISRRTLLSKIQEYNIQIP